MPTPVEGLLEVYESSRRAMKKRSFNLLCVLFLKLVNISDCVRRRQFMKVAQPFQSSLLRHFSFTVSSQGAHSLTNQTRRFQLEPLTRANSHEALLKLSDRVSFELVLFQMIPQNRKL